MRGKIIKWIVASLLISTLVGGITYYFIRPYLPNKINFESLGKPHQDENGTIPENPFQNWQERKRKRALAVIIDNADGAGAQSGLDKADVVVEVPVEGGLTRLLAIISADSIDLLGPIRSLRPTFVDLAKEYNAVLVHAGGSAEGLDTLGRENQDHIDEIYGGSKAETAFWRVSDRPKPYNLYASSESLRKAAKELGYNLTTPPPERTYLKDDADVSGTDVSDLTILYPNRSNQIAYKYDKDTKVFQRYKNEKPHLTAKGEQLMAANVIVQYVPSRVTDGDGRLQLILHGEGKTLILRQGKVIEGLWKKEPDGFTQFTDMKGRVIPLAEGTTWIEVVRNGTKVNY